MDKSYLPYRNSQGTMVYPGNYFTIISLYKNFKQRKLDQNNDHDSDHKIDLIRKFHLTLAWTL